MRQRWDRRQFLKQFSAATGALMLPARPLLANGTLATAENEESEIQIGAVSPHTLRLSVLPIRNDKAGTIPMNGSLVQESWGAPVATLRGDWHAQVVNSGSLRVHVDRSPLTKNARESSGSKLIRTLASFNLKPAVRLCSVWVKVDHNLTAAAPSTA
jgi:hypothetical protein